MFNWLFRKKEASVTDMLQQSEFNFKDNTFSFDELVLKHKGKIVAKRFVGEINLDKTTECMIEWLIKYEGLE